MPLQPSSLASLAAALDDSDDIILFITHQPDGRLTITDRNHTAERALGAALALQDLIAPDQSPALAKLSQSALARTPRNGDLRLTPPHAKPFWFGYHVMPCPNDPALSLILGRDITAKRAEREQANAVQNLLAKVFVMADAAVAIVGPDGRFQMTNPYHDRLLGHVPGALTGKQSRDLIAPQSREALQSLQQSSFTHKAPQTTDLWLLRADGSAIEATLSSALVEGADQRKFRVVTVTPRPTPEAASKAGKIRTISIASIQSELAERWPALESKAMTIAAQLIKRRLGATDTCARIPDAGFTICLHNVTELEATTIAEALEREIRVKLIGHGEPPPPPPEPVSESTPESTPEPTPPAPPNPILTDESFYVTNDVKSVSRPIFFTKSGARMGQFSELSDRRPDGTRIILPPSYLDRSLHALRLAAEQAQRQQAESPHKYPVLFALDFELFLTRAKTTPIRTAFRALEPAVREALIPVLCGLPAGLAPSKLADVQQQLRPFFPQLGFAIDPKDPQIPALAGVTTPILVIDGAPWRQIPEIPDRLLLKLAAAAKPFQGHVLARHIPPGPIRQTITTLGVDLFTEPT